MLSVLCLHHPMIRTAYIDVHIEIYLSQPFHLTLRQSPVASIL